MKGPQILLAQWPLKAKYQQHDVLQNVVYFKTNSMKQNNRNA